MFSECCVQKAWVQDISEANLMLRQTRPLNGKKEVYTIFLDIGFD